MKRSASRECIIAYHEAGHAVASWRLGDGITRVTIEPSCDAEREERYDGSFTAGRGDRSALGGWGFRYAVMVLAGPAAQRAYDPRSQVPDTAGYDHRELDNLAVIMCRSPEAQRAFVAWAKAEARALIRQDCTWSRRWRGSSWLTERSTGRRQPPSWPRPTRRCGCASARQSPA